MDKLWWTQKFNIKTTLGFRGCSSQSHPYRCHCQKSPRITMESPVKALSSISQGLQEGWVLCAAIWLVDTNNQQQTCSRPEDTGKWIVKELGSRAHALCGSEPNYLYPVLLNLRGCTCGSTGICQQEVATLPFWVLWPQTRSPGVVQEWGPGNANPGNLKYFDCALFLVICWTTLSLHHLEPVCHWRLYQGSPGLPNSQVHSATETTTHQNKVVVQYVLVSLHCPCLLTKVHYHLCS